MERWNSWPLIVRQILLGTALFLLGALLSFGYSYRPLHGALTWKVDSLETRLDERNRENATLSDELRVLRANEATRIEPEALAQIETELAQTKKALRKSEKKLKSAERKRRNANTNADRWRKRYESLRDTQPSSPAVVDSSPAAPDSVPLDSHPASSESATADTVSPATPATRDERQQVTRPSAEGSTRPGSDERLLP